MATEEVKSQENPYEVHGNSVNNLGQGMPSLVLQAPYSGSVVGGEQRRPWQ